jgi:hypothetical protein
MDLPREAKDGRDFRGGPRDPRLESMND